MTRDDWIGQFTDPHLTRHEQMRAHARRDIQKLAIGRCQLASPRDDNYPVRLEAGDLLMLSGLAGLFPWSPF